MGEPVYNNRSILWIDDRSFISDGGAQVLSILGFRPLTAQSGAEALKIYKRYQQEIQLVVLDFMAPDIDGFDACLKLANINPVVKILVITGYSDSELVRGLFEGGCIEFVKKPLILSALLEKMNSLLNSKSIPLSALSISAAYLDNRQSIPSSI